jgi:hypothetical protein
MEVAATKDAPLTSTAAATSTIMAAAISILNIPAARFAQGNNECAYIYEHEEDESEREKRVPFTSDGGFEEWRRSV